MFSGFIFHEDGNMSYMVNTAWYPLSDDRCCFEMSCLLHKIKNKVLSDEYEIMRANVEQGTDLNVMIDFDENGTDEFRVYKVFDA